MKPILLAAFLACGLAGCAEPARVDQMVSVAANPVSEASSLHQAIVIGSVTGGTATNPLWLSKVDNPQFQEALQTSLRGAGLLAPGTAGRYRLDARLESLDQPLMGFDLKVTSSVHYTVTDTMAGKPFFDQGVTVDFTAGVSDAFAAVERLRLANEGSIRKNIQTFMDMLIAQGGKSMVSQIDLAPQPAPGG